MFFGHKGHLKGTARTEDCSKLKQNKDIWQQHRIHDPWWLWICGLRTQFIKGHFRYAWGTFNMDGELDHTFVSVLNFFGVIMVLWLFYCQDILLANI